jgi:hypothetical protein
MKCTLRYIWGTLDYGLLLRRCASSELMVYTDADWVGFPNTRQSTSGYPHHLVFEALERHLSLECQGRVPGRGQWRGGGLLAAVATS